NSHQRRGECSERMRQRSSLRHRRHRHPHAHRRSERRTEQEADYDPGVGDDLEVHERADDGHQHAELSHVHPALGGFGMAQALQSENKKDRCEQVTKFDEVGLPVHYDLSADYADFTDSKKELATKKHKRLKRKIPDSGSISVKNLRSVLISFC